MTSDGARLGLPQSDDVSGALARRISKGQQCLNYLLGGGGGGYSLRELEHPFTL